MQLAQATGLISTTQRDGDVSADQLRNAVEML